MATGTQTHPTNFKIEKLSHNLGPFRTVDVEGAKLSVRVVVRESAEQPGLFAYHERTTLLMFIIGAHGQPQMELDGEVIDLESNDLITISPGCRYRYLTGIMRILLITVPGEDASDVHFTAQAVEVEKSHGCET